MRENVRLKRDTRRGVVKFEWDAPVGAVIFDWAQTFSLPEELQNQIHTVIVMQFFLFDGIFIV